MVDIMVFATIRLQPPRAQVSNIQFGGSFERLSAM